MIPLRESLVFPVVPQQVSSFNHNFKTFKQYSILEKEVSKMRESCNSKDNKTCDCGNEKCPKCGGCKKCNTCNCK